MKSAWLKHLNLTETELKVMDALLEIKLTQNVTFIAEKADLPRTTTLYILKKFQKRKLAERIPRLGPPGRGDKKRYHWRLAHIAILK